MTCPDVKRHDHHYWFEIDDLGKMASGILICNGVSQEQQEHSLLAPRSVEEWGHPASCEVCQDLRNGGYYPGHWYVEVTRFPWNPYPDSGCDRSDGCPANIHRYSCPRRLAGLAGGEGEMR